MLNNYFFDLDKSIDVGDIPPPPPPPNTSSVSSSSTPTIVTSPVKTTSFNTSAFDSAVDNKALYSDVEFRIGDTSIYAHKIILYSASSVFQKRFESQDLFGEKRPSKQTKKMLEKPSEPKKKGGTSQSAGLVSTKSGKIKRKMILMISLTFFFL